MFSGLPCHKNKKCCDVDLMDPGHKYKDLVELFRTNLVGSIAGLKCGVSKSLSQRLCSKDDNPPFIILK